MASTKNQHAPSEARRLFAAHCSQLKNFQKNVHSRELIDHSAVNSHSDRCRPNNNRRPPDFITFTPLELEQSTCRILRRCCLKKRHYYKIRFAMFGLPAHRLVGDHDARQKTIATSVCHQVSTLVRATHHHAYPTSSVPPSPT